MVVYSNGMRYATSGKHPWVTTTWERAEKRRRQAFESDWKDFGSHEGVTRLNRAENDKKVKAQLRIIRRVKQKHPEFSNVKARLYARKHGLFAKASSGHSGGGRNLLWLQKF